jgi:hypothetical protein
MQFCEAISERHGVEEIDFSSESVAAQKELQIYSHAIFSD